MTEKLSIGSILEHIKIMKIYMATLGFVQHCRAEVLVRARSLAGARRKAERITAFDVDWNPADGKMSVERVAEYKPLEKARQTRQQ